MKGNAGIAELAELVNVDYCDVKAVGDWVDKKGSGSSAEYVLYALPDENAFYNQGLSSSTGKNSYNRTKAIVSKGLTECQEYLGCEVRFKETAGLNNSQE